MDDSKKNLIKYIIDNTIKSIDEINAKLNENHVEEERLRRRSILLIVAVTSLYLLFIVVLLLLKQ